ncbi:DNA cytosine methyltransferase [Oryzomonas rubra]|uniref:DNA (cytosine-5-)-methyltransferase n=1 Tax=Oryzomonas rubra TaxID=2509454 RepID=A0A5A9X6K4_9BACT|nr:DNA cytosine methyltransferase [Oryzomonas rubra]KAA0888802.1 DNA cytosine methyltransferase [Oryzomonas rubra]
MNESAASYLSLCSGIEAATVAWDTLGWVPVGFSEVSPFPCAVLAHHYPDVPNFGDMTKIAAMVRSGEVPAPDILVGGTPCQAFSVAGLRKSMEDDRGKLTLEFVRILDAIDDVRVAAGREPAVCIWENVPGCLNTPDNAFGCFLAGIVGEDAPLVPGRVGWTNAGLVIGPRRAAAWRILDAQYFGVPQRRRRVFVVASARDRFNPGAVLFERKGMRRDTAEGREAGACVAALTANGVGTCGADDNQGQTNRLIASYGGNNTTGPIDIATACNAKGGSGRMDFETETFVVGTLCSSGKAVGSATQQDAESGMLVAHTLRGEGFDASEDGTGRGTPLAPVYPQGVTFHGTDGTARVASFANIATALRSRTPSGVENSSTTAVLCMKADQQVTAFNLRGREGGAMAEVAEVAEVASLRAASGGSSRSYIAGTAVRRLTPVECARLQGFPDHYTQIPWRGKPAAECPDGPQYKAYGNSMAVPCMHWLGLRLKKVMESR